MDVTEAFEARAAGRGDAASRLLPQVYHQLRVLAERYMRRERPGHSLRPSDLVHEACLRLIDASRISWQGKTHFLAVSAKQMRHILVDHARARRAQRRGGGARRLTLDENLAGGAGPSLDLLALDEALDRLAAIRPRQARTVELRFFGGLTIRETAYVLGITEDAVKVDWRMARAWLLRELESAKGV
jgi:RNA polymerase sigma factor (TIGR02999 family)